MVMYIMLHVRIPKSEAMVQINLHNDMFSTPGIVFRMCFHILSPVIALVLTTIEFELYVSLVKSTYSKPRMLAMQTIVYNLISH